MFGFKVSVLSHDAKLLTLVGTGLADGLAMGTE